MPTAVSVLIPTYNRAAMLPATLDAILAQRYAAAEVIVVDDGSTDNTADVLARFGSSIQYHRVANGRVCRARNIAASFATSPFLALCDSDDLWRDDKLAEQMELHRSHPELRYSFTNFSVVSGGVRSERTKFEEAPHGLYTPSLTGGSASFVCGHSLVDQVLQFQPVFPSTVMIRRDFFDEIGGFNEALGRNVSEDLEFTLRCVRQGPIGIVRRPVVDILKHESNFSGDLDRATQCEIEILEYALEHHPMNEATRALAHEQIALRRAELSYGAFRRGDFKQCAALLRGVPPRLLDRKLRLKLLISRLPRGMAQGLKSVLVRD